MRIKWKSYTSDNNGNDEDEWSEIRRIFLKIKLIFCLQIWWCVAAYSLSRFLTSPRNKINSGDAHHMRCDCSRAKLFALGRFPWFRVRTIFISVKLKKIFYSDKNWVMLNIYMASIKIKSLLNLFSFGL